MSEITNDMINAIDTSSVLSFLAENINLYNWYLLRKQNPNCSIYDETDNTLTKVRDLLFKRAEENNEVCIQLKNAVLKLELTNEAENNGQNSYLLTNYIQLRQCNLYNYNIYPETECLLWSEVKNINPPQLYVKLNKLEDIYNIIISFNEIELRERCYNDSNYYDYDIPQYVLNYDPPTFGFRLEYLELEEVYLENNIPDSYVEDSEEEHQMAADWEEERDQMAPPDWGDIPALKVVDTNIIMEFDCPICYEAQTSGNKCATTTCGHQYCETCFEGMTQYKAVCAMCRGEISEYIVSIVV
jgi:hypothetical protein